MGHMEDEVQVDGGDEFPSLLETLTTEGLKSAFQSFAESQHSEENLAFWWDVEAFRQLNAQQERLTRAKEISSVRGFELFSFLG